LNPADNPYLQWIMTGRHTTALPLALRPEHCETIRANLGALEWYCRPVEDFLAGQPPRSIDRFNLSDIFEYMSEASYHRLLGQLAERGRPGGRLAYWNMLVPRSRPEAMADRLRPLPELSQKLHLQDKAFFYSRFVVEEVV
jgi:S-adenosylmethionine-diacylglycerol 3-amino-3-carboxypropyl transferase